MAKVHYGRGYVYSVQYHIKKTDVLSIYLEPVMGEGEFTACQFHMISQPAKKDGPTF